MLSSLIVALVRKFLRKQPQDEAKLIEAPVPPVTIVISVLKAESIGKLPKLQEKVMN